MGTFDDRLRELKELTNTAKNVDLAKVLGISPKTVSNWKYRDNIPDDIFLKARSISQNGGTPMPPKGYISLDIYEQSVSAGSGTLVVSEEKSSDIVFSESFIHNEIGVTPTNIFLMPVKGDSMYPTLRNGALIMVNKVEQFTGDSIYVFRYDGQLMVKRLQFSKEGLTVVSDNDTYKEWNLTKSEIDSNDFEIIGEVVWSGQRM